MIINKKTFFLFSFVFFLLISLIATTVYTNSARKINHSFIDQQLSIASETIRLRLASIVNRELALVLKLADTMVIRQYFKNPNNPELETLAHLEFDTYLEHFDLKIVFWVNDVDKIFYSTGNDPYVVDPDDPESYWYNLTLYGTDRYNFNINYNPNMQQINLWINVMVFDKADALKYPIGMLGTGINLSEFSYFIVNAYKDFDENIIPYTFNKFDEITSAENYDLVFNKVKLDEHLGETGKEILEAAHKLSGRENSRFIFDDKIFLVSSIPEMEWFLVVSYPVPGLFAIDQSMNTVFFSMLLLIMFFLIIINIYIARSETALEKQNIQLTEANKKSEVASRAKSDFLAAMSHELRTPLNTIIGFSEIELNKSIKKETAPASLPPSEKQSQNNFNRIHQSGLHLLRIINDLLDLSKLDSGKFEIIPDEYSTSSMINSAVDMNIIRIGSKPIQFILEIQKEFPAKLIGDELRIKQILSNLLSNAIKYTKEGIVKLSINFEEFKNNEIIVNFTVTDTGIGIRADDINKLFDDYTQLDTRTNKEVEGTGLGLSISKKIAQMMGGDITAESEYGKGSCFSAFIVQERRDAAIVGEETAETLRRCQQPQRNLQTFQITDLSSEKAADYAAQPKVNHSLYTILAVDDHLNNLLLIREQLKPLGIHVDTASSGQEALEKIKSYGTYDLIIMDHMMPGMDGIETLKVIRSIERYANIPVIVLTANALRGMREYYLEQGFTDFIAKPVDQNTMNEVIKKCLNNGTGGLEIGAREFDDRIISSVFSGEIIRQRIDKLNHICAGFEIDASGKEIDGEYKKCCRLLRSCCEQFQLIAERISKAEQPAAAEIVMRLQNAILSGDTVNAGKTLKELGTAFLSPFEREKYFNIYDALMDDNNEKALERIKEWLE